MKLTVTQKDGRPTKSDTVNLSQNCTAWLLRTWTFKVNGYWHDCFWPEPRLANLLKLVIGRKYLPS